MGTVVVPPLSALLVLKISRAVRTLLLVTVVFSGALTPVPSATHFRTLLETPLPALRLGNVQGRQGLTNGNAS